MNCPLDERISWNGTEALCRFARSYPDPANGGTLPTPWPAGALRQSSRALTHSARVRLERDLAASQMLSTEVLRSSAVSSRYLEPRRPAVLILGRLVPPIPESSPMEEPDPLSSAPDLEAGRQGE